MLKLLSGRRGRTRDESQELRTLAFLTNAILNSPDKTQSKIRPHREWETTFQTQIVPNLALPWSCYIGVWVSRYNLYRAKSKLTVKRVAGRYGEQEVKRSSLIEATSDGDTDLSPSYRQWGKHNKRSMTTRGTVCINRNYAPHDCQYHEPVLVLPQTDSGLGLPFEKAER